MKFRTSYLVGLMATVLAVSSTTSFIDPAIAADTPKIKPLKIMGPDGQIRQVNHQYGPTTSKDTFWSIAQKVRPDASVSVYQVMAAVFDANPHAFNSDSYNSLERGMILLIPSKEVMLAIPNSLAIARAERSDKQARSGAKATPKAETKPATKPAAPTQTVAQPKPKVETPPKAEVKPEAAKVTNTEVAATPTAPKMVSSDINARLEAAESKNLSLTDELARAQDQLAVRNTDVETLKAKVEELNQQIAVLEETLQASKKQNLALKAEVEAAQTPETATTDEPAMPAEPDDLWRNLMSNPLLLVAAAVIPALLLLVLVFWLLRRKRNKERRELESQQAAMMAAGAAGVASASVLAMDDDDLGDMAVHLDTDHADSIDSLLDVGSVDLQPEQDMTDSHEQMDMASEMFIDPGVSTEPEPQFEEDEGQSLDDLWAEAMGDQEEAEAFAEEKAPSGNIIEEEDLDALLAGLGADEEDTPQEAQASAAGLDDLDELAGFDLPAEPAPDTEDEDLAAAIAAELDSGLGADLATELDAELENDAAPADDDIDALLAGFNQPEMKETAEVADEDLDALLADYDKAPAEATDDLGDEIAAELDDDLAELGVAQTDDIDALLADFDKPAAPEPDLSDEIAAELDDDLNDIDVSGSDDIDALLAGLDAPAQPDPEVAAAIAAELDDELAPDLPTSDEDLDQLLAGFNTQEALVEEAVVDDTVAEDMAHAEAALERDDIAAELEAALPEDLSTAEDDLDSLLAEFDVPEQAEADADDFNFDLETTHVEPEEKDEEEDLLKGIGAAAHAIDGTDDTFELSEEIADNQDSSDNSADDAATEPKFTGFDEDTDDIAPALGAAVAASAVAAAASAKEKESSFFNDLKANKSKDPHVLDWDTELNFAPTPEAKTPVKPESDLPLDPVPVQGTSRKPLEFAPDAKPEVDAKNTAASTEFNLDDELDLGREFDLKDDTDDVDLSDDSVLAAFSTNTELEEEEILTPEDSFALDDEHTLTVDEALAALDAQESRKTKKFVPEHDLTNFQNEHGYIDIEKLLNDAEQDSAETDLYPEMDVEMSDVGALIGDAAMIDVDDEENSVNAKLDLARAYIEIDDSDSAKALLREVQIDGNERQQEEAARLLKEMG
ncbi:putative membrane protein [Shewanella sp. MR-4]|uniref:FimV/HubP family polar landmark protein n=1 Tax=Shewanella sp. (strain MR-4) TaxID=60480 RepID=UPI00005E5891|nr:FimV/HubP family polar landmark protein [Shewanella sp. MR-4]ABI38503.1 putative membrane protein [Shewanella sp. MR-4]